MKEECLICGAPLEYLEADVQMQCEICRKKELAKTRCVNGHYVCSDCHMQGLDSIVELCLRETACDPIAIVERMMALPSCHMHGPEHHVMVGAALLTKSGKVYLGCNIENAAYGPSNCAERTAFFKAVSEGEREFAAIAVVGGKDGNAADIFPPCGVCRQVMQEFCAPSFMIYMGRSDGTYVAESLGAMLPYGFTADKYMK